MKFHCCCCSVHDDVSTANNDANSTIWPSARNLCLSFMFIGHTPIFNLTHGHHAPSTYVYRMDGMTFSHSIVPLSLLFVDPRPLPHQSLFEEENSYVILTASCTPFAPFDYPLWLTFFFLFRSCDGLSWLESTASFIALWTLNNRQFRLNSIIIIISYPHAHRKASDVRSFRMRRIRRHVCSVHCAPR